MSNSEYLLLIPKKGKSFLPLKEKFKELHGFYNGIGYAFPKESTKQLEEIIANFPNSTIHKMPLSHGQTFNSFKHSHKASFFKDKLHKINLDLLELKNQYSLEEFTPEILNELNLPSYIIEEINEKIAEKNKLQDAIIWAEAMEKALSQNSSSQNDIETQIQKNLNRCYESFETEHKNKIATGGFITGFEKIDEHIFFSSGDLNVIQAMSNHGKTTFMLNLCYKFLTNKINSSKNPLCVFITYESSSIRIEEKFLNIISSHLENKKIIQFNNRLPDEIESLQTQCNYLYPNKKNFSKTINLFNTLVKNGNFLILERIPLEFFDSLITSLKNTYPQRKIILFLDYIQILKNNLKGDGWEKIKDLAYWLEEFTIKNEIITFTGSQVNDKRETREGKDIYNAATNVIDIFNNSHAKLQNHNELKNKYREKVENKSIISITGDKAKNFSSFYLENSLLFDGFKFESNDYKPEKENYPQSSIRRM